MKVCTIGFKGRSAREFFEALKTAGVAKVIDVRRNNSSQLAGYTKGRDLEFFLVECFGIAYEHVPELAPSTELLGEYRKQLGKKKKDDDAWAHFVEVFTREIGEKPTVDTFSQSANGFASVCLLCSESTAERCHRRLLAEHIGDKGEDIEIEHL